MAKSKDESKDDTKETKPKKKTGVGPRDGRRAFSRIRSILSKLQPDIRREVMETAVAYSKLSDGDEVVDKDTPSDEDGGLF